MENNYIEEDWERISQIESIYLHEDEQEFNDEDIPEYEIIEIENEIYELNFLN